MINSGFIRIIEAPVCLIGHVSGFRSEQDFKRHIVQVHGKYVKENVVDEMMESLQEEKRSMKELTESEKVLSGRYWGYYVDDVRDKEGMFPDETLSELPGLPVIKRKQCTKCFLIIGNDQKSGGHKKACDSELREIDAQSILSGRSARYFRVKRIEGDGEDVNWIYKQMMEMKRELGVDGYVPDVREMGSFISQLRCRDHLRTFGIDVEEGWNSVNWTKTQRENNVVQRLYGMVNRYIKGAIEVCSRNVFVKTHVLLGQRIHVHLGERTIIEYVRKVCGMLYFVVFMYRKQKNASCNGCDVLSAEQMSISKEMLETVEQEDATGLFHKLMFNLFLSVNGDDMQVVPLFIACSCVIRESGEEGSYRFANSSDVSHILAALLHFLQCVVVQEVYGNGYCAEEGRSEQFSLTRIASCKWGDIEKIEQNKEDCGALYVRYCMNLCNTVRTTEMAHIRFVVCQRHEECGILDGKELSLEQLGKGVKSVQEGLRQMMADHLLFGFDKQLEEGGFWDEVRGLTDNYCERRKNYWFVDHPSNVEMVTKWMERYTMHMASKGVGTMDRTLDRKRCKIFLCHTETILKKLLWLLQVTGGGPARMTELLTLQYRNGGSGNRSIFVQQGRVMFVILGHKGRDKSGGVGKPIARFPDFETGKLLLLYLLFLRPLEEYMCWKNGKGTEMDRWCSIGDLFSVRGIALSERVARDTFKSNMKEFCGEDMQVSEYRQYHAGVVKNFVSVTGDLDGKSNQLKNSIHEQSGHATETANSTYGVSELDMRHLDSVQLEQWRRSSYKWHSMLKIEAVEEKVGSGCIVPVETVGHVAEGKCEQEGSRKGNEKNNIEFGRRFEMRFERLEKKMEEILEYITKSGNRSEVAKTAGGNKRLYRELEMPPELTLNVNVVLNALRKVVKNGQASFRDKWQKEALMMVGEGSGDGLYIMPTGSGKSLLFMVQPVIRPNSVCIVIVPLVALQGDLVRKCAEVGISGVLWKDRNMAGATLVFCSCEHVVKADYKSYVKEMWKRGKLFSIFVDEAHLVLQWVDFRPVLCRLGPYIRPEGCSVSVNALTATCPPCMEAGLISKLCLRGPLGNRKVRQSGVRKNISYVVNHCAERNVNYEIVRMIGEVSRNGRHKFKRMIIYCLTRKECDSFVDNLKIVFPSDSAIFKYHAGMNKSERNEEGKGWSANEGNETLKVMFATSAFGCGIDIPDVRMVVHIKTPRSIISFLQESGRAGRDGERAVSVVMDITNEKEMVADIDVHSAQYSEEDVEPEEELKRMELALELFSERKGGMSGDLFGSLKEWVQLGAGSCRRHLLDRYGDGICDKKRCGERGLVACDLCGMSDLKKVKPKEEKGSRIVVRPQGSMTSAAYHEPTNVVNLCEDDSLDEIREEPDIMRTPVLTRRMGFGNGYTDSDGEFSVTLSQSRSVGIEDLKVIVNYFDALCAVCSVKCRKEVCHNGREHRDDQKCAGYKQKCFRCGSGTHRSAGCFTLKFQESPGSCFVCSLKKHANEHLHDSGTYGTKSCPNRNGIRIITVIFEDEKLRTLFNKTFPEVAGLATNENVVEWLKKTDEEGHTWYADVIKWIKEDIIHIV